MSMLSIEPAKAVEIRKPKRSSYKRLGIYLDRVTQALPTVLMALIALITYWMVKILPAVPAERKDVQTHGGPNYSMEKFTMRVFDNHGALRQQIKGLSARHFSEPAHLDIQGFQLRSETAQGKKSSVLAEQARLSKSDQVLELFKNAMVVREAGSSVNGLRHDNWPQLTYQSEYLYVDLQLEVATSNKPVTLYRGGDRFTADRMQLDQLNHTAVLEGRVKTMLAP
jgi:lipopolysaccharide export system protein LptC